MIRKKILLFFLLFTSLFTLVLNNVGLAFREKITIKSSLDFSWFSDLIERYLHGYILGRDFTFTYGPLFQFIYSLPSILFNVPSYISVGLAPILSFIITFFLILYISRSLTKNIYEQIAYILFIFLVLGLLISSNTDTVRMLIPMMYGLLFYNLLLKKFQVVSIIILAILPTIFGLYSYNLFITTFLIAVILILKTLFLSRKNLREIRHIFFILPLIILSQILLSFLLTHNLDYILNSLDTLKNYRYVMNLTWTTDRSNILIIFPISLLFLFNFFRNSRLVSEKIRKSLAILVLVSLLELMYGLSRSDAGHFLYAIYPSIIAFYTIIFFLSLKFRVLMHIGIIFYVLIPYKPELYNKLAPKNIIKVFQVIKEKPSFISVYKLPQNYYLSKSEINDITKIVKENKDKVYIYPYDSFILNSEHSTYNSFALGTYTYSNSLVEANTVRGFNEQPPSIIILQIDTKGALNLDDIFNFTRNPLLAEWIVKNYTIKNAYPKYVILTYNPVKKVTKKSKSCKMFRLTVDLTKKESILQRTMNIVKPPLFYLGNQRLPYSPYSKSYLLFQDIQNARGLLFLFNNTKSTNPQYTFTNEKGQLIVTRVSPFLRKKGNKIFNKNEFYLTCLNSI